MNSKEQILTYLFSNPGKFVSGQEIADSLGISRNAVSKNIISLRNDGYDISAVNRLGYSISESELLSAGAIRAYLPQDLRETEIICLSSIDSTNNEAKKLVSAGSKNDLLVVADEQTGGRGRNGHSFYSPSGSGLYLTAVLHPSVGLADSVALTTAAAVSVAKTIKELTGKEPAVKWVNDVYLDGKKVCGILTEALGDLESMSLNAVIVGIGINVSDNAFPPELSGIAGSLSCPPEIRSRLAAGIYKRLHSLCALLPDRSYMDDYRAYSFVPGKRISFTRDGKEIFAEALHIEDDGGLRVLTESGKEEILRSGEISVRPL